MYLSKGKVNFVVTIFLNTKTRLIRSSSKRVCHVSIDHTCGALQTTTALIFLESSGKRTNCSWKSDTECFAGQVNRN